MNAIGLMNQFHNLNRNALDANDYEAAMVYSTAEDLTDNLMKGDPADGSTNLINAFRRNADLPMMSEEERTTWAQCVNVARSYFAEGGQ